MVSIKLRKKLVTALVTGVVVIAGASYQYKDRAMAAADVLVSHFEGIRHVPYRDSVGVLTVCYGHTGADIVPGKWYSDAECQALKQQDLQKAKAAVDRYVKVPITPSLKAALIDFTYNLGPGNLSSSTLLRQLNSDDFAGAHKTYCAQFARWIHAGKKVLRGLVDRREAEAWLC